MSADTEQILTEVIKESGSSFLTKEDWLQDLHLMMEKESESKLVVLLQGPDRTLEDLWQRFKQMSMEWKHKMCILEIITPKSGKREGGKCGTKRKYSCLGDREETVSTFEVSHEMVGGVIDHEWKMRTNVFLERLEIQQLQRHTRVVAEATDYLSTTERGDIVPVPSKQEQRTKVAWKQRSITLCAKSVFASTGWVKRRVTSKELMLMYDMGNMEMETILKHSLGKKCRMFSEFTQQVPVRVLSRLLEVLDKVKRNRLAETAGDARVLKNMDEKVDDVEWEQRLVEEYRFYDEDGMIMQEQEKLMSKNDDAEVKVPEWNERVCNGLDISYCAAIHDAALDSLRKLVLLRYRSYHSGVIGSFRRFMKGKYGIEWLHQMRNMRKRRRGAASDIVLDYEVGMDAIKRASASSFWEWDDGSTVLFWRWPRELQSQMRDGMPVWFRERDLPSYWGRQRWPEDLQLRQQLEDKVFKVVNRRYIVPGYVNSLTSFFAVPKGTEDIRVVYDATKSGLNAAIWTPNFMLPTATLILNNATERTFFGDIDLGEMFLNFFLDKRLRPLAGVDLGVSLEEGKGVGNGVAQERRIMRWERSLMGVKSSPFNCVRAYLLSEDIIKGDHLDPNNPFRWDSVVLNLPGTGMYDPVKPWIYKYDEINGKLSSFVVSYVDDLRTGDDGGKDGCDKVTHHVASFLNYLGEQDAARKRGSASQQAGAWAGSVIESRKDEGLFVTISQEKWTRVKTILEFYREQANDKLNKETVLLDYKRLEQDTGFLVHVFMTYENLRPYLKGFYLTLNEWRFDRDEEGWKVNKRRRKDAVDDWLYGEGHWELESPGITNQAGFTREAPKHVRMVPQMERDVELLSMLFNQACPSKRLIRGVRIARILYGFGDASGAGFGAAWEVVESEKCDEGGTRKNETTQVRYRFGRWGGESEGTSSNFRELKNLVESLEEMGEKGELSGVEVFLFTDNSTAEAACSRGLSSSKPLFELVKHFKLMEMVFRTKIRVIHVASARMIAQGADGLSRGCLSEGVMRGEKMEVFIPLHLSAADRAPRIIAWLQEWCHDPKGTAFKLLKPNEWYVRGQDITGGTRNCDGLWTPTYSAGNYVWAPPPCVAYQCLEELRKARHKRQASSHIFVCPRIMTVAWQRHLYKSADIVLVIPPGHENWGTEQYEPLMVGLYFPYLPSEPWQLKGTRKILGMAGHLQRVLKTDSVAARHLLRQLWTFSRQLLSMPQQLVLRVLQGTDAYKVPKTVAGKRRGTSLEKEEGRRSL